jgi:hypothetical protein
MVYLSQHSDLAAIVLKFGSTISEITQPFDNAHLEKLSAKNLVVIRKSLLHNKYQHVIYFNYDREGEIKPWLRDYAKNEPGIKVESDSSGRWNRVYMVDDSHLTLFQLTWQDRIHHTKSIQLIANL